MADDPARIRERDEPHVLPVVVEDLGADGADEIRFAPEQEVEDRDVVRGEVPDRIDVPTDRTEACPARIEVVDVLLVHVLLHLADACVVEERVPDEQQEVGALAEAKQLLAVLD